MKVKTLVLLTAALAMTSLAGAQAVVPQATINASVAVSVPQASAAGSGILSQDNWNMFAAKQPAGNYLTGLTGDVIAAGPGVGSAMLPMINSTAGACGDATHVCQIIDNAKGLVTSQTPILITGTAGQNGLPGRGIAATAINAFNHLIVTYTDGTTADVGNVVGANGTNGTNGMNGINAPPITSATLADLAPSFSGQTITIAAGSWHVGNATFSIPGATIALNSLVVSGATNASPITLTVSSTNWLHNGDTMVVSGVGGNTAANGTWAIVVDDASHIDLMGSVGNGSYTSGGTVGGPGISGNGMIYVEANESGSITVKHSQSAGLIVGFTGSVVENQEQAPAFDSSATQVAIFTVSNGTITAMTDKRAILGNRGITAGLGIAVNDMGGSASVAVDATVARTTSGNVFTGSNQFTGGLILVPAGNQPLCTTATQGWLWRVPGSATVDGALQICDYKGGSLQWVTH